MRLSSAAKEAAACSAGDCVEISGTFLLAGGGPFFVEDVLAEETFVGPFFFSYGGLGTSASWSSSWAGIILR